MIRYHNLRRKLIAVGLISKESVEEELCVEENLGKLNFLLYCS